MLVLVLDAGVVAAESTAVESYAAGDCAGHLGPGPEPGLGAGAGRSARRRPMNFCASGSRSRERDLRARQRALCGSTAAGALKERERPGSLPEWGTPRPQAITPSTSLQPHNATVCERDAVNILNNAVNNGVSARAESRDMWHVKCGL